MDYFKELYFYLPRAGPGDSPSTRRAFLSVKGLPSKPQILDLGCGPGAQTLDLLELSDGVVTAVDIHPEMLFQTRRRVQAAGITNRVNIVQADMNQMEFPPLSFDLIWSEAAIYIMGFRNGLSKTKPLLKPGASVVVSEIVWLKPNPPQEVVEYWREYPEIDSIENKLLVISKLGYDLVDYFVLPRDSWTKDYYTPLEEKVAFFQEKWRGDIEAKNVLDAAEKELSIFNRFSDYYGYAFFILQS